jgi:hypothetical protein
MPNPSVRKSVSEISRRDLDGCPVWEFASDEEDIEGQDETTVRPFIVSGELDPSAGMLVVRARFQLADRTEMTGYLTPCVPPDNGLDSLQPVIVTDEGQVLLWWGVIEPKPAELSDLYRRLGKASESQVFPILFASDVAIAGGPLRGEVTGFMVLEDWRTNQIKLVR